MTGFAAELRRIYPRVIAKTLALTRSIPDAEDAVQDAIERALETWPRDGRPESPEAWLVTVAANSHRDRVRRALRAERHSDAVSALSEMSPWARIAVGEPEIARGFKDELLGLLFACCHPALEPGESAALALATVIGLSNDEIARAFLVPPRTMEQRLTRARRRLRERGDYEGARPEEATDRIDAVLRVLYLLFNEGYWSGDDDVPIRADLCRLAIGLARSLHEVFPEDAEVAGLLALVLLHDARRDARLSETGATIALPEQDRTRWDAEGIRIATDLLERTATGSKDASPEAEVVFSCPATAQQCFDFDNAVDPTTGWSSTKISTSGATITKDRTIAKLGFAALFTVDRPDGFAHLLRVDVPWVATKVAVETDFYIEQLGAGATGGGQVMYIANGTGKTLVLLYAREGSAFLQEYRNLTGNDGDGAEIAHHDLPPFPTSKWMRLRLELELSPARARLFVDGAPTEMALADSWVNTPVRTSVGLGYVTPTSTKAWKYRYDNVVIGAP